MPNPLAPIIANLNQQIDHSYGASSHPDCLKLAPSAKALAATSAVLSIHPAPCRAEHKYPNGS